MTTSIASIATTSVVSTGFTPATALNPEEQMLALIVYSQTSQMDAAKTTIDLNAEQLQKLREQVQKALHEAMEAKKDSGFWGGLAKLFGSDLASLASAVAAVAAIVASGGAAAPILAAIAVAASFAAEHAEELGIPADVAMGIAIAASVAALCVGNTKGLFDVSKEVAEVAGDVHTCALGAAIAFKAEGTVCGFAKAGYERAAQYAQANARDAGGRQDLVSADMDAALDQLSHAFEQLNAAAQRASSIQQQTAASRYAVLDSWAGVA